MYIRYFFAAFIVMIVTTGCTKDFNPYLNKTEPLFVIQGRISNLRGPYYVRITKSTNLLGMGKRYDPGDTGTAEVVTGAQVIISDDTGISDTLIPANATAAARYSYSYWNGAIDSVKGQIHGDLFSAEQGFYQTTKITGEPGHTYHLRVTIGDSVFESSAYMPYVPTLDSASVHETVVNADGSKGLFPFAYFSEPQNEKNYYLLQFNDLSEYPYDNVYAHYFSSTNFPFYIVDDKILPPYVNGLAVRIYISGHYQFGGPYPSITFQKPLQVRLSSLTKETYNYFDVLRKQLENDGSVYKPVPASAAGNISNGALGLFYATHISYKIIIP